MVDARKLDGHVALAITGDMIRGAILTLSSVDKSVDLLDIGWRAEHERGSSVDEAAQASDTCLLAVVSHIVHLDSPVVLFAERCVGNFASVLIGVRRAKADLALVGTVSRTV
ncbi:hypothetical protein HG531_000248 [Fusarium graminearum]|nr:hypothetical protein HG531_000248 [Fusarium graminearum]